MDLSFADVLSFFITIRESPSKIIRRKPMSTAKKISLPQARASATKDDIFNNTREPRIIPNVNTGSIADSPNNPFYNQFSSLTDTPPE
ncbi:uncharacterized protein [Gossypium hirsutum]|uniref:Uncharacterized protein isoform X2 n=1 Tax=Gossypium hirsutum TaxID=3635 RepID=A0ABM2Z252_GOSHI|nr:uncharacterized protein LOC121209273 isoform X2 [Gossypium hirsutum]